MSEIQMYNLTVRDLEEVLTSAMDKTINYILRNKITLEQLEKEKNNLAIMLCKPSLWKRFFKGTNEKENVTIYIVKKQQAGESTEDESETTNNP